MFQEVEDENNEELVLLSPIVPHFLFPTTTNLVLRESE
jgi:hypothetical protein